LAAQLDVVAGRAPPEPMCHCRKKFLLRLRECKNSDYKFCE